jgi:hypothetical protein
MNINALKKFISTNNMTFLTDIDKSINVDKRGKAYYFKMFKIELDYITNFISNLEKNEIYLINPIISVNAHSSDPYLTLSRQFLLTDNSNPNLIYNYLSDQEEIANSDFVFEEGPYFLIFKYKKVY